MRARLASIALVMLVVLAAAPAGASFADTEVLLPSVGRGPGAAGSDWYTTLWVTNLSPNSATVALSFYPRGPSNPAPMIQGGTLAAGETTRLDDVIGTLFGLGNAFGALRVQADQPLLASSRIYSQPPGGGPPDSVGQFFAAIPVTFAIGAGQSTDLQGVFQYTPTDTSPFRYNFGFAEVLGGSVTIEVTALDPAGAPVATKTYSLGEFGVAQYAVDDLVPGIHAENLRLHVAVVGGGGRIVAFGSGLANVSNDPSTFEMMFDANLLAGSGGLSSVAHDGSLTGDGTAGSPLGVASQGVTTTHLADAAVTTAQLSASGSSAGDVLTSDGSSVSWQAPSGGGGLTLPYSGSSSTSGATFSITSDGDGPAILGRHGSTGNYADIATGSEAIKAVAFTGDAVLGLASLGDGVSGESSADDKSGVYGANQSADGYGVYGANLASGSYGFIGGTSADSGWNVGLYARGEWAIEGRTTNFYGAGVYGESTGEAGVAVSGIATAAGGIAVNGYNPGHLAGSFTGNVDVSGSLSKGGGSFRIDHPLDPEGRYLSHSFVESPDMMNIYNGNIVLDSEGHAWVELPDWFEALNRDFRYQLTPLGAPAPGLYVAREVAGNRFLIAGGEPGQRVSWQVTGIRHDPWAEVHRIPVEEDKPPEEMGTLLHPEAYGEPDDRLPPRLRRLVGTAARPDGAGD